MRKKFSRTLRITKATYYDPQAGPEHGTDVTSELASRVTKGQLIYDGIYNNIFPDRFKRVYKRLMVVCEFGGKEFIKYYNENEKINLPSDLGLEEKRWWEKPWFHILALLGTITSILAFIALFLK